MPTESAHWDLDWDPSHTRIQLRIEGHLVEDVGRTSAARLLELTDGRPFELVADLSLMTGYDRASREAWQHAFIKIRGLLHTVHFVGLGPVFRMAAATVCLATGTKAHFYESADAIPTAERVR